MASFEVAFEWTMDFEDPERKYAIVPDDPPGAHALSGINSAAFPQDFANISVLDLLQRPAAVQAFYKLRFWSPWIEQLTSDEPAKRIYDAEFNMGEGTGVKLLQMAVENVSGVTLGVDGLWGPATLHGANTCNPDMLAAAFRAVRIQHYRDIVVRNPAKAKFLANWLARAGK